MSKSEGSDTIQVYCRIRPVSESHCQYSIEQTFDNAVLHFKKPRSDEAGYINNTIENYEYKYTGIFDQQVDQDEIFDRCAKKCVLSALEGYNSTIFAYGQSGSGKTYTMTGGDGSYEKRGIIPRAISLLFEESSNEGKRDREYTFSVSYMEIYKGFGYDLLNDKRDLMDIKELPETMLNESSTRSHCIFTVNIESKEPGSSVVKSSKLHMVDLAGSERPSKTNSTGKTLEEAKSINLSLYFLERFIMSISEGNDHIPWRDSLITTVLKDSIGGNCKTIMISTINPSYRHLSESVSTCKFSMRVASIKQNAVINEKVDPYVQIRKLKKKVEELEEELKYYRGEGQKREALDGNEKAIIKERVDEFLDDLDRDSSLNLGGDHLRIREAFLVLKSYVLDLRKRPKEATASKEKPVPQKTKPQPIQQAPPQQQVALSEDIQEKLKNLSVAIELRDIEIDILVSMLNKKQKNMSEVSIQTEISPSSQIVTTLPPPSPKRSMLHTFTNGNTSSMESIASMHRSVERKPIQDIVTKEVIKERIREKEKSILSQTGDNAPKFSNEKIAILADATGMRRRAEAFELFRQKYRNYNVIEKNKEALGEKIAFAKEMARDINDKRSVIEVLKNRLIQLRTERAAQNLVNKNAETDEEFPEEIELKKELLAEKDRHQDQCNQLKELKKEIEHLKRVLEMSRVRLQQDFENWYKTTNPYPEEDSPEESISSQVSATIRSNISQQYSNSSIPVSTLSFDSSSSPISSTLSTTTSSSSRPTVKQAWGVDSISPKNNVSSNLMTLRNNNQLPPQQQQQGFSEDNPFFKKLKEHVEQSSTLSSAAVNSSANTNSSKRVSLLQQAYKL
ncbi:kinesin-9 [Naegleria gruberi]|uniref:Kinesin-like protein n=1 Tax=Naegleria gruberi TaxID=5762 RepID=D2V707_NAEGR|nr:kinesin-9 [Naegleria gruberi]EFC47174.1 kinesin-9 [Naegleria gruberi]|eukprot:XP_002679918.1 kinesin-9 [Naegleria gruberi]